MINAAHCLDTYEKILALLAIKREIYNMSNE